MRSAARFHWCLDACGRHHRPAPGPSGQASKCRCFLGGACAVAVTGVVFGSAAAEHCRRIGSSHMCASFLDVVCEWRVLRGTAALFRMSNTRRPVSVQLWGQAPSRHRCGGGEPIQFRCRCGRTAHRRRRWRSRPAKRARRAPCVCAVARAYLCLSVCVRVRVRARVHFTRPCACMCV